MRFKIPKSKMFNTLRQRALCLGCCCVGLVNAGTALPLFTAGVSQIRPNAAETTSATISLSDLDLSTTQGLREARVRLTKAAQHLCSKWTDDRKVDDWATFSVCTQESLAKALKRLPAARLDVRN